MYQWIFFSFSPSSSVKKVFAGVLLVNTCFHERVFFYYPFFPAYLVVPLKKRFFFSLFFFVDFFRLQAFSLPGAEDIWIGLFFDLVFPLHSDARFLGFIHPFSFFRPK